MDDRSVKAQERALQRIVFEEEQRMQAEERERQRAAEQEKAAQVAAQLAAEAEASRILATLHPLLDRRNEAVQKLYAAITELLPVVNEINTGIRAANDVTRPYLARLDNYLRKERNDVVWRNSGLPDSSNIGPLPYDAAGDLAYTIALAISHGIIIPGGIVLPNHQTVPFKRV